MMMIIIILNIRGASWRVSSHRLCVVDNLGQLDRKAKVFKSRSFSGYRYPKPEW